MPLSFFYHLSLKLLEIQKRGVAALPIKGPGLWIFTGGLFSALAFEPFSFDVIALLPGLWLLLYFLESSSLKRAFFLGWAFGFGHFLGGLYWICISLMVDFSKFFWLMPFALGAIPACLGCLSGLSCLLARAVGHKGQALALSFCFFWCAFEWLRGHIWGGFPWNLMGYTLGSFLPTMQIAHTIGIYGLSLLALVMAVLTFHKKGVWISALLWGGLWLYGTFHMQQVSYVPGVNVRLVQPCIEQALKWNPNYRQEIMERLKTLSQEPGLRPITHIIWPESAAVFDVYTNTYALNHLASLLKTQQQLIFGAPAIKRTETGTIERLWNALFVLDHQGKLRHLYNKVHLVPFGEYVPFREYLSSILQKITPGTVDYSPGTGLKTISMATIPPFSPLICYESIFPGAVANFEKDRPQWLLNSTNDGWFGISSGPYQHLAMAQVRAIETGLPLVRVANNGISVITDAYGRIMKRLPLNQQGVIDGPLPQALPMTLYNIYGDLFFFVMMGSLGSIVAYLNRRQKRNSHVCRTLPVYQ